jgi:predicted ATP-grasp superfamily ATP-dependent carboligase
LSIECKNILLTGGRAFVTLDLARQFARHGYRVVVAESIPIHFCRYSRCITKKYLIPHPNTDQTAYIDALIDIIHKEKIDQLIPTCEEIFFIAQGLDRLREHCYVFVAALEQMQRLHSKWDFIQCASRHGLLVPDTHLLTSHDDLQHFLAHNHRPFVLKPVYSRFGTKVIRVDNAQQPRCLFDQLTISENYSWVAQELLSGQAFCTYSIASSGRLLAHAVYPVTYTADLSACIHFESVGHPDIDQWVLHFLQQENFSGQIAFDIIVTPTGTVYPIECNPRATSGIHLFQAKDQLYTAFLPQQSTYEKVLKPQAEARAMIAFAMVLYGLPVIRSWARFRDWLHKFLHARDVIFDVNDIKPFLYQPLILWYNWKESRKRGISIQEFSTVDIQWDGPEISLLPQKEMYL